jgi:hypothetical protein
MKTVIKFITRAFLIGLLLCIPQLAGAGEEKAAVTAEKSSEAASGRKVLSVPYAFYNDGFNFAAGYVYGIMGYPQKQSAILTTFVVGTNGSAMMFFVGKDLQVPFMPRLFVDPNFSFGKFKELRAFVQGNPSYEDQIAGSNGSSKDNFIEGDGWDNYFRPRFKYLLPIGHGKDSLINNYVTDGGLLRSGASGGTSWNPLVSGKTYLECKPFYRKQEIDSQFVNYIKRTNGFEFSLFRDNTDYSPNPSKGTALRVRFTGDWGWFDSSNPWKVMDAELSKYFSLGETERFRQRVLAFTVWTADCLTWNDSHTSHGTTKLHRPPSFAGATLGGLWRMRAFPSARYYDKSAIYYSAEYRMIPRWNPLAEISLIQKYLELSWWQVVPFVEVGRVAPTWQMNRLHSNMQWDAGLGVRAMAKGLVIRVDTAASEEGVGIQMMISQPFQF